MERLHLFSAVVVALVLLTRFVQSDVVMKTYLNSGCVGEVNETLNFALDTCFSNIDATKKYFCISGKVYEEYYTSPNCDGAYAYKLIVYESNECNIIESWVNGYIRRHVKYSCTGSGSGSNINSIATPISGGNVKVVGQYSGYGCNLASKMSTLYSPLNPLCQKFSNTKSSFCDPLTSRVVTVNYGELQCKGVPLSADYEYGSLCRAHDSFEDVSVKLINCFGDVSPPDFNTFNVGIVDLFDGSDNTCTEKAKKSLFLSYDCQKTWVGSLMGTDSCDNNTIVYTQYDDNACSKPSTWRQTEIFDNECKYRMAVSSYGKINLCRPVHIVATSNRPTRIEATTNRPTVGSTSMRSTNKPTLKRLQTKLSSSSSSSKMMPPKLHFGH